MTEYQRKYTLKRLDEIYNQKCSIYNNPKGENKYYVREPHLSEEEMLNLVYSQSVKLVKRQDAKAYLGQLFDFSKQQTAIKNEYNNRIFEYNTKINTLKNKYNSIRDQIMLGNDGKELSILLEEFTLFEIE